MNSVSNINPTLITATAASLSAQDDNRPAYSTLKSCFSAAGNAYYATPGWNLDGGAIGRTTGKKISAYMTQVGGDGYDIAAIGRKQGQRIAADIERKLMRQVRFSLPGQ